MANQRLNARIVIGAAVDPSLGKSVGTVQRVLGGIGMGGLAGSQAKIGAAIQRNNAALAEARMGVLDAVGAFYTLKGALGAPINAAASFETVLEDIGQKADIPVEKLGALGEQIKEVARDTNQSAMTIGAAVDALAGRGAATDVALAAAAPIGKAATAYRASTDDLAAAAWSAVDNLKVPADQIELALDAMAQAGKAGAFELRDMATYFPTLGAAYQGLGQTGVDSVADLAAALQIVRKGTGDASTAATNLGNVLQKIYANPTQKGFKKLGIDIRKEMEKAAKAGQTPIEAIAEITNKALKGDLSRLGEIFEDAQVQAGMRSLIQGMDEYKRIRQEAMQASGVLSADYERRIRTAAGATARWDASLERLSISLGTALLPPLNELLDRLIPVVDAVGRWVEANPKLASGIVAAGAGLIAFKGAMSALRFVGLLGKGGALELMALGFRGIGTAATTSAGQVEAAVSRTNAAASGLRVRALGAAGLTAWAMSKIPDKPEELAAFQAENRKTIEEFARDVPLLGSAMTAYDQLFEKVHGKAPPTFENKAREDQLTAAVGTLQAAQTGQGEIDALRAERERLRAEIAARQQAQAEGPNPMGFDFDAQALTGKLQEVEEKIAAAEGQTADLREALAAVGMENVAPTIDAASIDQALTKARQLLEAVRQVGTEGGTPAAAAVPAGAPAAAAPPAAPVPARAVGGYFGKGPVLVGEKGPELRFENRAGFIATARQTAALMAGAERPPVPEREREAARPEVGALFRRPVRAPVRERRALPMPAPTRQPAPPEMGALFRRPEPAPVRERKVIPVPVPTPAPPPAPPEVGGYFTRAAAALEAPQPQPQPRMGAEPVAAGRAPAASAGGVSVGQIHIHAQPGQDPRAIAEEVMRMIAARARGALYDGATA